MKYGPKGTGSFEVLPNSLKILGMYFCGMMSESDTLVNSKYFITYSMANLSHMDDTYLFMAVKVDSKKASYTIFNVEIKTLLLKEIKISINSCPGCGIEETIINID